MDKWNKIVLQKFGIRLEFAFRMMFFDLYRMSVDMVYQSSVPSCPFCGMSSSKQPVPDTILDSRYFNCREGSWCMAKWTKIGLQKF